LFISIGFSFVSIVDKFRGLWLNYGVNLGEQSLTKAEKMMLEYQRKELERLKNSGELEAIERMHKAITPALLQQLAEIKKPVKITPIDFENMRPTDKRIRKAEEILYNYTFQNKNADPDDILKALETIGSSRDKDTTKPKANDGMTLKQKKRIDSIQKEYYRLEKHKTPQTAKNMVCRKYGITPKTLKSYLKIDPKLPE